MMDALSIQNLYLNLSKKTPNQLIKGTPHEVP